MDNHHFMLKLSRLFPSSLTSCQFRTLPDVVVADKSSISNKILHENDHSSLSKTPQNPKKIPTIPKLCKKGLILSHFPIKKMEKFQEKSGAVCVNHSSSSNSGWFTSGDEKNDVETDAFFSLSSNSGDSFRLKTSRRFKKCEEMKSIDETGRCSFSSTASYDTILSKCSRKATIKTTVKTSNKKTWPENELGSDHVSTQLYYNNNNNNNDNNSDSGRSFRRRKTSKSRRKIKKTQSRRTSFDYGSMIGESYAVEKRSSDPHSDFRASMVEMIVEKQIFGKEGLERLLLCFLSLNSVSYHGMIFDVFSEICQTLFSN